MSVRTAVSVFVLLLVTVSVLGHGDIENERARVRRDLLQCKRQNETCRGFPRCCGTLHCHWEGGYNPLRSGRCIPCSVRAQTCQIDSQCCQSLVCQKTGLYEVDGTCDTTRGKEAACYRDGQCSTGYCNISTLDVALGNTGTCQDTPTK